MDTILLTITGLSLALAAAMGVLLARILREERRRSDARVALLTNAAVGLADLDLRPAAATPPAAGDLFHEHDEGSPWPRRFGVIAAMAALVAIVALGWSAVRPAVTAPAAASAGSNAADLNAGSAATAAPLELLALEHQQQEGSLTISGVVQNPRGGAALGRVHATVLVFGGDGSLLTSARAPLESAMLTPGLESPFVIHVPVARAARYRVGFRGEDDEPLGHVDRRDPDALARKEGP
ncbi:MAG TPA: hypothetical protein VJ813_06925 [Vicinamibacterales bacterium]|nr:hypothetical protein [Vicinamibacterales bacterium]